MGRVGGDVGGDRGVVGGIRDRVWVVAKSNSGGSGQEQPRRTEFTRTSENAQNTGCGNTPKRGNSNKVSTGGNGETRSTSEVSGSDSNTTNTNRFNENDAGHGSGEVRGKRRQEAEIQGCEDAADPSEKRLSGSKQSRTFSKGKRPPRSTPECSIFERPWPEVATELCRVDVSPTDRVHRLKALGNTIQWEVAYELMKVIKQIEETN